MDIITDSLDDHKDKYHSLYRYTAIVTVVWTIIIAGSLIWNIVHEHEDTRELAIMEARVHLNKDQAIRLWTASHGGVYVTPTEKTPPNPYLGFLPERDAITESGKSLTLVNPAYLMKQLMEFYAELYSVEGRLTSLKVLNPLNEPDEWERSALTAFEGGLKEALDFTEKEGEQYLRFMRPLMTEDKCLKCHGFQGYKVGDVRGGIGVTLPLKPYLDIERKTINILFLSHGAFWILGLMVIAFVSFRGRKRIQERRQANEQLVRQAYYDQLTGLPNRALFVRCLAHETENKKLKHDYLFAVLLIDLDRFKVINDSLGHIIGDQLLLEVTQRLNKCIRPEDVVARLGGDEFALLLKDCKEIEGATHVADRIQKELMRPFNLADQEVFITASIGIAFSTTVYEREEDILRDADSAMYRAKSHGRSRYELFDTDMYTSAMKLLQLEADLRRTVEQKDFMVYYQPVISMVNNKIVGAEAVVRWKHPQRGFVSPLEFIPLAEETGLISMIGEWVLRTACAQNKKWLDEGHDDLLIKVNFSVSQFHRDDIMGLVKRVLWETGLNARFLDIEITGSIATEKRCIAVLNELSKMDLRISIDDFGTGYSSLGSLKDLPINTIKIDQSFIKDLTVDPNAEAIVRAIIAMAHNLQIKVLAEGVETEEQLAFLRSHYCEEVQGFLFSPPVPAAEFEKLLIENRE